MTIVAHVLGNNYFPFQYSLIPNGTGTIEIRFYDNGTLHNVDGTTRTFSNDMSFSDVTINVENPTNVALNNIPLFAWVRLVLLSVSTVSLSVGIFVMRKKWTNKKNPLKTTFQLSKLIDLKKKKQLMIVKEQRQIWRKYVSRK